MVVLDSVSRAAMVFLMLFRGIYSKGFSEIYILWGDEGVDFGACFMTDSTGAETA